MLVKVVNYSGAYSFYFKASPTDAHDLTPEIAQSLVLSGGAMSDAQKNELRRFYRKNFSTGWQEMADLLKKTEDERKALDGQVAMSMVSKELDMPRDTYLLVRGEYDHVETVLSFVKVPHLTIERSDLDQARESLLTTIREIDESTRDIFMQTFESVGHEFGRIFERLFGGGTTRLMKGAFIGIHRPYFEIPTTLQPLPRYRLRWHACGISSLRISPP